MQAGAPTVAPAMSRVATPAKDWAKAAGIRAVSAAAVSVVLALLAVISTPACKYQQVVKLGPHGAGSCGVLCVLGHWAPLCMA